MKPLLQMATGLLLLFSTGKSTAQTDIQKTIRQNDSLFWQAYNRCDLEGMHAFIAEDVEFYHDKGGIENGWAEFAKTTSQNLCSKTNWHLRREAVAGSFRIYPMEKNGAVYGAVISGDHKFFVTENDKPEYQTGIAKFTHLWLLENGVWKMKRILSFDHRAPAYENKRVAKSMSEMTLKKFQGRYDSSQGVITVTPAKGSLSLTLGKNTYALFPESDSVYFSKERDLTFEFTSSGDKIEKLVVRENGQIVETAKRSQ